MSEIRETLNDAIPDLQDKLYDSVEPLYVCAVGAACWARQQILHPTLLQDVDVEPSFQTNMKVRSYESTINAYHVGSVGKKIY